MRLFYLVLLVIGVVSGCQPADKAPVSSRLLIDESTVQLKLTPADAPVETPLQLTVSGEDIAEINGEISEDVNGTKIKVEMKLISFVKFFISIYFFCFSKSVF